jgi:type IV secretory pathway TrbD component
MDVQEMLAQVTRLNSSLVVTPAPAYVQALRRQLRQAWWLVASGGAMMVFLAAWLGVTAGKSEPQMEMMGARTATKDGVRQ